MLLDAVFFLIAFFIIFLVTPYAEQLSIKILNNLRVMKRVNKVANPGSGGLELEEEEKSTGLNQKGSRFEGNALFSWIAEKNQGLIEEMQQLLLKAGLRQKEALEEFMKSKFNSCIAIFFIIFLFLTTNDFDISVFLCIPISLIAAIVGGHKLTNMNMEMTANKRKDSIANGIPDLVDLLVICTESGLDLNRSIRRIAREMRTSNPVLAEELSLTSIELEMIPDHRQVFENLEKRTDCLEIKTLSKTLSQSIEYGSSLSVSLKDLAIESRQKRMLNAEGKAAQAPTLLTLPMMFFIMPCLFIVMLGPVIVGMIKSFGSSGG
ncbi:MAG: type II secretion system F family protein [Holosporaceae bacterium]|jgi:tight adherence protein C|nr:type II secretion system F family protein [Holosporaceae bacterium]